MQPSLAKRAQIEEALRRSDMGAEGLGAWGVLLSSMPLYNFTYNGSKLLGTKRLLQKVDCAEFHRSHRMRYITVCSNDHHRDSNSAFAHLGE